MPGLLDYFGGNEGGNFLDAIGNNRNSLIGLGMGLLAPAYATRGESAWSNAMQGFQGGAGLDAQNMRQRQQLAQHRADQARAQANADRSFAEQQRQFNEGLNKPYVMGTPETGVYMFDRWGRPISPPGSQPGFTPGGIGSDENARAAPPARGAGPPGLIIPPQGKAQLTPHEMGAVEKADDAAAAFKTVQDNLNYAKSISKNVPSGILAPLSDRVGQAMPEYMSEQTKNRMLLQNAVTGNAVEQLRAIFGGNPTEGERKVLIDLQGSINAPDEVRQEIFDRAQALAADRMKRNQERAQQIRGGTYYRPGGGPSSTQSSFGPSGGRGGTTKSGISWTIE